MALVEYPYDPNGNSPANLVKNEKQTLTQINGDPFRYFIPDFAPFYANNFSARAVNAAGSAVQLKQGIDYNFSARYIGATRANGMAIYGAVVIINKNIQGPVTLTYQCLGGAYSANRNYVIQTIAQNNYNPRRIAWDQVTNAPTTFPPSGHPESLDTFTGFRDLNDAIYALRDARVDTTSLQNELRKHILDVNDPHKTLAQIPTDYIRRPEFEAHTKNFNDPHRTISLLPTDVVRKPQMDSAFAAIENVFEDVPSMKRTQVITVTKPHIRQFIWDDTTNTYIRAPWHRPGMMLYSHHNPTGILGYLPVRADITYNQVNYPDLAIALGLSGVGSFVLAEMRGEFLRVLDNGRNVDVGRTNLSWQKATLVPGYDDNAADGSLSYLPDLQNRDYGSDSYKPSDYPVTRPQVLSNATTVISESPGGLNTWYTAARPRNVAASLWVSY